MYQIRSPDSSYYVFSNNFYLHFSKCFMYFFQRMIVTSVTSKEERSLPRAKLLACLFKTSVQVRLGTRTTKVCLYIDRYVITYP